MDETSTLTTKETEELINTFKKHYKDSITNNEILKYNAEDQPSGSLIQSFIKTLSAFIENSQEKTLQGLNISVKDAANFLCKTIRNIDNLLPLGKSTLTLKAISEIMINMINKHISKKLFEDFDVIKMNLVVTSNNLLVLSQLAKDKIFKFFSLSMKNDTNILIHGNSLTVLYALLESKKKGFKFKVYVTESRPLNSGLMFEKVLTENKIDCRVILDSSVGYYMKDIDCVLVGSEVVAENGGILNSIGTYTLAICAKYFKKPFYVLAESLKFLRIYPLDQSDVISLCNLALDKNSNKDDNTNVDSNDNSSIYVDYTPPEFITLLFTDIGIFTPSAVSDELIQMFN